jgi:exonuclease III
MNRILAAYVPSRDASLEKTERKQRWITEFTQALTNTSHAPALLVGDLNVLEPDHQPHYRTFAPRLSDHSALSVRLTLTPTDPLLTSDPAEAASPPTLF